MDGVSGHPTRRHAEASRFLILNWGKRSMPPITSFHINMAFLPRRGGGRRALQLSRKQGDPL
jgi:hypothetical protein